MLDFLGRSWENYITLKFSYVRTETNPTLVQLIGYDDTVVIVGLDSALITCTVGVVMSTRWSSMLETAVAEEPRLIFIASPMASITIGLNVVISPIRIRSFTP